MGFMSDPVRATVPDAGARRLRIVGVMGSALEEHPSLADPLGAAIANLGVHLLTGGGSGTFIDGFGRILTNAHGVSPQ